MINAPTCEVRRFGNPMSRLTAMGYCSKSPTVFQVKLDGERIWRRVYCRQFSNSGVLFIERKGEFVALSDSLFWEVQRAGTN